EGAEDDLAQVCEWHAPSQQEQATRDFVQHLLGTRRGAAGAHEALLETLEVMQRLDVRIWFTSHAAVRAEGAWLRGVSGDADELQARLGEALALGDRWLAGALAGWRVRLGHARPANCDALDALAAPYALELEGNLRGAAAEWERLGCPYERAIVLAGGDED